MTRRTIRLVVVTALALTVAWVLSPLRADACGGPCPPPNTEAISSTTTSISTASSTSTSVPPTTAPPSTVPNETPPSSPSSTPSPASTPTSSEIGYSPLTPTSETTTTVEQPGAMCTDGCTETYQTSSTNHIPTSTLSAVSVGAAATTGTVLPATGSAVNGIAVAAVLVLGLGIGAALLARRAPAVTDKARKR